MIILKNLLNPVNGFFVLLSRSLHNATVIPLFP